MRWTRIYTQVEQVSGILGHKIAPTLDKAVSIHTAPQHKLRSMRSMESSSYISSKGIAAIVGVGPGLGLSVARKFAFEGYTVAILARDLGRLSKLAEEIALEGMGQVFAIRIDCSDSRSVREAFEGVLSLGFLEVLVYNASCHLTHSHPTSVETSRSAPLRSRLLSPHIASGEGSAGSMDPDGVAQTYWNLHTQDKSAWTQEIHLSPSYAAATTNTVSATAARNFF